MEIAITVRPDSERISPMYDAARHILQLHFCRRTGEMRYQLLDFPVAPAERLLWLQNAHIHLLITGAIANEDVAALTAQGIRVCPFTSGTWQEVWAEWKKNENLSICHLMPGCQNQHQRCCRLKLKGK